MQVKMMTPAASQTLEQRLRDLPAAVSQEMPGQTPIRIPMSFEQFLAGPLPHERYEWENGEAVEMAAVDWSHTLLHTWLIRAVGGYVEAKRLGEIVMAPYPLKLPNGGAAREPDIMFISNASRARVTDKFIADSADLVIEVVSPGSEKMDRDTKFYEYEQAGVGEYLIADLRRKRLDPFILVNGVWRPNFFDNDNSVYRSRAIEGLWLEVDWLWDRPPVLEVLKTWGLVGGAA